MKTMLCLILDRSGSMGGRENDVVNGVNALLTEQKNLPDPATIAFVRFDSEGIERFRQMGPLADCKPLDRSEYQPRGGTPLLDAVGQTISTLDQDWQREQPERAIVVIVTDGEENASKEYTKDQIKQMILARQDSGKWSFIYLGANVDSFAEAGAIGIFGANTANYQPTAKGMAAAYGTVSQNLMSMRSTGSTIASLGGDIQNDGSVKPSPSAAQKATWRAPNKTWQPPEKDAN